MSVYVSKNIIIGARKDIEYIYTDIAKEQYAFGSVYNKAESKVKDKVYQIKDAVHKLEKEIDLAKKAIDENQNVIWKLEEKINKATNDMANVDWELSKEKSRHISKPKSTGDAEADKKAREAYEAECRAQEERIDALQNAWFNLRDLRDSLIRKKEEVENAQVSLKNIITSNGYEIDRLNHEIRTLEESLRNLKQAINLFESNVNSILRELRNINDRVGTALKYYSNAVEKFREASITISDNETIKIANIDLVLSKLGKMKKTINDSYQLGNSLSQNFIHANAKLKDNIMTESGKYINNIRQSCDEVIDSLKRMEEIISSAMGQLKNYSSMA